MRKYYILLCVCVMLFSVACDGGEDSSAKPSQSGGLQNGGTFEDDNVIDFGDLITPTNAPTGTEVTLIPEPTQGEGDEISQTPTLIPEEVSPTPEPTQGEENGMTPTVMPEETSPMPKPTQGEDNGSKPTPTVTPEQLPPTPTVTPEPASPTPTPSDDGLGSGNKPPLDDLDWGPLIPQ